MYIHINMFASTYLYLKAKLKRDVMLEASLRTEREIVEWSEAALCWEKPQLSFSQSVLQTNLFTSLSLCQFTYRTRRSGQMLSNIPSCSSIHGSTTKAASSLQMLLDKLNVCVVMIPTR